MKMAAGIRPEFRAGAPPDNQSGVTNWAFMALMWRNEGRRRDSLALRSAYARLKAWRSRLEEAESVDDEQGMREAANFIAEYEDFMIELESL